MDMMNMVASTAVNVGSAQFSQQYKVSLLKKTMDQEAQAAQEVLNMLPRQSGSTPTGPALGKYIDVYA